MPDIELTPVVEKGLEVFLDNIGLFFPILVGFSSSNVAFHLMK